MKGEVFISMLKDHANVINKNAAMLTYARTRQQATEDVLGGRFSLLWLGIKQLVRPGLFRAAVDARHKTLLVKDTLEVK